MDDSSLGEYPCVVRADTVFSGLKSIGDLVPNDTEGRLMSRTWITLKSLPGRAFLLNQGLELDIDPWVGDM